MSDESIKPLSRSNKRLNLSLNYVCAKTRVEIKGDYFKQDKISFDHGKVGNIYIVYKINRNMNISSYPTLETCLFGAVKLTKHTDIDQYKYFGYSIGFDRKGFFSIDDKVGRNVMIFGVDMRSSPPIDNKKKDILILGKGSTLGPTLKHKLTSEKLYLSNFTKHNTKFCWILHYNGANSCLFVNGTEIIKFKARDAEIVAYPVFLGNISKEFSVDNVKKTGLKGNVYDFSVDYNATAVADVLDIHKYLMEKNGIV